MLEGTDSVFNLILNTESSNISYKSFEPYNLPMQNSYCDHRNFDRVNQSYDSCLITEHSYGGTVEGSVSTHVPIQIVLITSKKVAL